MSFDPLMTLCLTDETPVLGAAEVGTLPLSDTFSLYGKLGFAQPRTNATAGGGRLDLSASRTSATYGLGGIFNVSPTIGIRFGWDRHAAAINDTDDDVTFYKRNFNVNVYSLGAVFKF